ncbi:MAG: carbohydrate ABC transporter permease [Spirochaetaceae bacterium]|nr:carbohydrate ABC transporter permease [Spirochaetaceae bacterium]
MYQNQFYVFKRRLNYLVWLVLCVVFLFFFVGPFVWMVTTSFKTPADIIRFPPRLFPELWVVDNYVTMWNELNWLPMFANSFWITGVSVFLLVMVSALGGFSFAKMRWPLRTFCFLLIVAGLIVPTEVDMIPRFLMMTSWGLTGTYIPVILLIIGQGFQTFMIRQFIGTIPDDYFDAAKVDGMGYVWMFIKIVLPLSKAGVITMAIFSTFMVWNQYVYPLIYLTKPHQFTLQLGLGLLQQRLVGQFGPLMAAATMVSIPTLIIYLMFQQRLTSGIAMTGVKG